MGYDFHITRADNWTDSEADAITAEEWLAEVAADPELTIDAANGPYFAVWNGTDGTVQSWLDWSEGEIFTKNPRRRDLAKMLVIADRLGAKVQGDEGEVYAGVDDMPSDDEFSQSLSRRWWKFWSH